MLEARQTVCGYFGKEVVHALDLEVRAGEIVLLLGPNGSGKSTLMKTLIGALDPLGGSIHLDGHALKSLNPADIGKLVGYVPQDEDRHFAFTVSETVLMGRLPYASGMFESADDLAAAKRAIEAAGCEALAGRPVTELSGGEFQRVLIARALAQEPKLLALDEPASHFDAAHSLRLMGLLQAQAAAGMAVLAVVHDLGWAAQMPARAYLLSQGSLVKEGPVLDVIHSPEIEEAYGVRIRTAQVEGRWAVVCSL